MIASSFVVGKRGQTLLPLGVDFQLRTAMISVLELVIGRSTMDHSMPNLHRAPQDRSGDLPSVGVAGEPATD
jgi:hypothetical protein